MKIKEIAQATGAVLKKNSPTILTGLAVAGLIGTTVLAVKATPKALEILKEAKDENPEEDIKVMDTVKLTWKCYIPTVAMGSATILCMIFANGINQRRNAALASLYSVTEETLKVYESKVKETIGAKKNQQIKDDIAQDKLNDNPLSKNQVIFTGHGEVLCYDSYSGRYFRSDLDKIRKIENELNKELIGCMYISLNEVYDRLGLEPIKAGDELGWKVDNLINFNFTTKLAENDEPCVVIDYLVGPRESYSELV